MPQLYFGDEQEDISLIGGEITFINCEETCFVEGQKLIKNYDLNVKNELFCTALEYILSMSINDAEDGGHENEAVVGGIFTIHADGTTSIYCYRNIESEDSFDNEDENIKRKTPPLNIRPYFYSNPLRCSQFARIALRHKNN